MLTHKGTITLRTPRLTLRRFTLDDAQGVFEAYTSDANVGKSLDLDSHTSIDETKEMLKEWTSGYDSATKYHWVIVYRDVVVGEINLFDVADREERCELGYTLGSKWWNQGIATEAVAEIIRYAFEEVHFNKICAQHNTENVASGKVMQKNHMKQEGLFRAHKVKRDGTKYDTACYAILRDAWHDENRR